MAIKAIIIMCFVVSLIGSALVIIVMDYEGKQIPKAGKPIAPDSYQQWNSSQWENWARSLYTDHPELQQYFPQWFSQLMQNELR